MVTTHQISKLESVLERDIDLLILEEFHCSKKFQDWFIESILQKTAKDYIFLGAWHSVTHPVLGESDLEIEFQEKNGCKLRILIENKIDALLQPEQVIRYSKRGLEYIANKTCDQFLTVLVCPSEYLKGFSEAERFHLTLTYESLKDYFQSQLELGLRGEYKASILTAGIEEARRGYKPVINDSVSDFWMQYWKLATTAAPELEMPKPNNKPKRAGFVVFKPIGMPSGIRIVHKLGRNSRVDLEFSGMASKIKHLKVKYQKFLMRGMDFVIAGKSAAVRIKVADINTENSFDSQLESVQQGLDAAKQLYDWISR